MKQFKKTEMSPKTKLNFTEDSTEETGWKSHLSVIVGSTFHN